MTDALIEPPTPPLVDALGQPLRQEPFAGTFANAVPTEPVTLESIKSAVEKVRSMHQYTWPEARMTFGGVEWPIESVDVSHYESRAAWRLTMPRVFDVKFTVALPCDWIDFVRLAPRLKRCAAKKRAKRILRLWARDRKRQRGRHDRWTQFANAELLRERTWSRARPWSFTRGDVQGVVAYALDIQRESVVFGDAEPGTVRVKVPHWVSQERIDGALDWMRPMIPLSAEVVIERQEP